MRCSSSRYQDVAAVVVLLLFCLFWLAVGLIA